MKEMKIKNVVCRLCMHLSSEFTNIFEINNPYGYAAATVIKDLLQLKATESDCYPNVVCNICLQNLKEFRDFKQRCLETKFKFDKQITTGQYIKFPKRKKKPSFSVVEPAYQKVTVDGKTFYEKVQTTSSMCMHSVGVDQQTQTEEAEPKQKLPIPVVTRLPASSLVGPAYQRVLVGGKSFYEKVTTPSSTDGAYSVGSSQQIQATNENPSSLGNQNPLPLRLNPNLPLLLGTLYSIGTNQASTSNPLLSSIQSQLPVGGTLNPNLPIILGSVYPVGANSQVQGQDLRSSASSSQIPVIPEVTTTPIKEELIEGDDCQHSMSLEEVYARETEDTDSRNGMDICDVKVETQVSEMLDVPIKVEPMEGDECDEDFNSSIRDVSYREAFGPLEVTPPHGVTQQQQHVPHTQQGNGRPFYRNEGRINQKILKRRLKYGNNFYKCDICGKETFWKGNMANHVRIHARNILPYKCKTCPKSFETSDELEGHENQHFGDKQFFCEECPERYKTHWELVMHETVHRKVSNYTCKFCGKGYKYISHLSIHERSHTGTKPYECSDCGRKFTALGNLKQHSIMHMEVKPYSCVSCGRSFTHPKTLRKHVCAIEEEASCDLCSRVFKNSRCLKIHRGVCKKKVKS